VNPRRQAIAGAFSALQVFPSPIDGRLAVWTPRPGVGITGAKQ
jgi:hypothetical protein